MEIRKSELMQFLQRVQGGATENSIEKEILRDNRQVSDETVSVKEGSRLVSLDGVRGKVLSLHDEVKSLQTALSYHQTQKAWIENNGEIPRWREELTRFMKDMFTSHREGIGADQESILDGVESQDQATQLLSTTEQKLNHEIIRKEVQLENLISSGLAGELPENIITRDMAKSASDLFTRLKSDQVRRLLES